MICIEGQKNDVPRSKKKGYARISTLYIDLPYACPGCSFSPSFDNQRMASFSAYDNLIPFHRILSYRVLYYLVRGTIYFCIGYIGYIGSETMKFQSVTMKKKGI